MKHIVLVSSLGTKLESAPHLWESYFATEQALMRSRVTWTIVRMAYYAETLVDKVRAGPARGVHVSTSSTPVNFVSRADEAATVAAVLASEGHAGAIYQATGNEAYGGDARAAVIASAVDRPFPFVQTSREQYAEGLRSAGLPPFVIDAVLSIQDMWKVGGFDVTAGDVERLSGTPPRRLAEVLAAAFPLQLS